MIDYGDEKESIWAEEDDANVNHRISREERWARSFCSTLDRVRIGTEVLAWFSLCGTLDLKSWST